MLDTSYGTYVGHTHDVKQRLKEHERGRSVSTRGGKPVLLWASKAFNTREEGLLLEARLKDLRDTQNLEFAAITGIQPTPFDTPRLRRRAAHQVRPRSTKKEPNTDDSWLLWVVAAIVAFVFLFLVVNMQDAG